MSNELLNLEAATQLAMRTCLEAYQTEIIASLRFGNPDISDHEINTALNAVDQAVEAAISKLQVKKTETEHS